MSLKDIMFISGQSGLYKYVSQGRATVIVENMADQKRSSVAATAKISMLDDIAIFTDTEDVPLGEVFNRIKAKENGGVTISPKSPEKELRDYFESILPDYDRDRVYLSDIRKVLQWYNELIKMGITDFDKTDEQSDTEQSETGQSETEQSETAASSDEKEN